MIDVVARYSVCLPTDPPQEVHATRYRDDAFAVASTIDGAVVYDWRTGERITDE